MGNGKIKRFLFSTTDWPVAKGEPMELGSFGLWSSCFLLFLNWFTGEGGVSPLLSAGAKALEALSEGGHCSVDCRLQTVVIDA